MLNRARIFEAIQSRMRARGEGDKLAVLILHLHGLHEACLRSGYHLGDEVSAEALDRIGQCLRPGDAVIEAGEGVFAVTLGPIRGASHALLAATRLVRAFEKTLICPSGAWRGRVIMGIALYPDHGDAPEQLCRHAEIAHDAAWRHGEQFAVYTPDGTGTEVMYSELRDAIEGNQLQVYFQSIWDISGQCVVGFESLARWTSPLHGEVSPAVFVPFAEQSDLITALTHWNIHATLRHAAVLRKHAPHLTFAINLSPRVFVEPDIVEQLLDALDIWGVPPRAVIAEVTETALVEDFDLSVRVLERLRERGMRVAIDDFGTGYASFAYLRRFPATDLKIDYSLIEPMLDDERARQVVRGMIDVAHHMDMQAIAEGVENQATLDMLGGMGCDMAQGFHISRPIPAAECAVQDGAGG